jgi:hypothetical protein
MWYTLARITRLILIGFWTLFFLGAVGNYLSTLAHDPAKDFTKTWSASALGSLLSGPYGLFIILVLVILIILTIIAFIVTERSKRPDPQQTPSTFTPSNVKLHQRDTLNTGTIQQGSNNNASPSSNFGPGSYIQANTIGSLTIVPPVTPQSPALSARREEVFTHYLHCLVGDHKGLNPKGMHQSQLLISVNVPLDDIFIHLKANPDTPVYDIAELEDLLHDQRLSEEQREVLRQKTHIRWESQKGLNALLALKQRQNVTIEKVLQAQNTQRQASVLLGAPGSGKSTALRWLTLHMSQALLPQNDPDYKALAQELLPLQLPVLLRIGDYARQLETDKLSIQQFPFDRFLKEHLASVYSEHAARIVDEEMQHGRCLFLLDGLDEVASNTVRHDIITAIQRFLRDRMFLIANNTANTSNRCIITSRIVGYEKGNFTETNYAHYTLLELEEEQVASFLTVWCPAVERFQAKALYKTGELSAPQEQQVAQQGLDQKERLLRALKHNPRIKRLAANPLMLTILALVQRSNKQLPQRRIELYDIVTRTLLDTWNKESGRMFFTGDDISLAEHLLCELAYRLHTSDPLLSRAEVEEITRKVIAEKQERDHAKIPERDITDFLDTIRSSSGLFVESGLNLFSFMHRTFQEYYVARFLLNTSQEQLKTFVVEHYHQALWREPFLLALAAKSSEVRRGRDEASTILTAVIAVPNLYDTTLQQNLLFAATCIVDCGILSITKELQARIANGLFDLYVDIYDQGRYQTLHKEIEQVALAWLQMQEQSNQQQGFRVPLLATWHDALCNVEALPERQEGAVFLLASIAPDLVTCPAAVLHTLLPPLIVLAGVQDMSYPPATDRGKCTTSYHQY